MGEKSKPPNGGKNNLKGLQIWLDICNSNLLGGKELTGATQLITIPPTSAHQPIVNPSSSTENKDQEIIIPKLNKTSPLSEIK